MSRPPKYETPEEMQKKAEEFFDSLTVTEMQENKEGEMEEVIVSQKFPTITGLCLYLGFCSRQSFYDYAKKDEFSYTVKRLHMMIESAYEQCLKGNAVAGVIFALKNLGWSDKQEIEQVNNTVVKMDRITYNGKELEFNVGHRVESPEAP